MSSIYNVCTKHNKHMDELVELEIAWADGLGWWES